MVIEWADEVTRVDGMPGRVTCVLRGMYCVKWEDEPDPRWVRRHRIRDWKPGSGQAFYVITLLELELRRSAEIRAEHEWLLMHPNWNTEAAPGV